MLIALFLLFSLSFVGVFAVERLSHTLGIYDICGERKLHTLPKPRLGGVGFVIPLLLFFAYIFGLYGVKGEFVGAFIGLSFILAVGVFDDLFSLSPCKKFIFQVCASIISSLFIYVDRISFFGSMEIYTGRTLGYILSVILTVISMNAINLADGIDTLAVFTVFPAFAVASLTADRDGVSLLFLAVLFAMLGFLPRNLNPAKCFMGDCGSQSLGFLIGYAVISTGDREIRPEMLLPVTVPIFDMLLAVIRRIVAGRSPFSADAEHIHHKLIKLGIPDKGVASLLFFIGSLFSFLTLLLDL